MFAQMDEHAIEGVDNRRIDRRRWLVPRPVRRPRMRAVDETGKSRELPIGLQ
jgi:hypothetical protein